MKCHFKGRCGAAEETIANLESSTASCFAWEKTVQSFRIQENSLVSKESRTRLFQYQTTGDNQNVSVPSHFGQGKSFLCQTSSKCCKGGSTTWKCCVHIKQVFCLFFFSPGEQAMLSSVLLHQASSTSISSNILFGFWTSISSRPTAWISQLSVIWDVNSGGWRLSAHTTPQAPFANGNSWPVRSADTF